MWPAYQEDYRVGCYRPIVIYDYNAVVHQYVLAVLSVLLASSGCKAFLLVQVLQGMPYSDQVQEIVEYGNAKKITLV